jgi:hypothetical protein
MAKPNKKLIQEKLDELGKLRSKIARIDGDHDKKLAPITDAYNKKRAPIDATANDARRPIEEQCRTLEAEITKEFGLGIDIGARTCALYQVSGARMIAEVQTGEGSREIAPEKLFEQIPAAQRDSKFWGCVKILIGPAQKAYGSVVDLIAEKPWTANVVFREKS